MSVWIYRHWSEGVWQKIPYALFDRFSDGNDRIPNPSGATVEFAEVWIDLEARIPVELLRLVFLKMPINPDGSLDRKRYEELKREQLESIVPECMLPARGTNEYLMAASRLRFARRRANYLASWRPSASDVQGPRVELANRGLTWDGIGRGRFGPSL